MNRAELVVEQLLGNRAYLGLCEGLPTPEGAPLPSLEPPMVALRPMRFWKNFIFLKGHGMVEATAQVEAEDYEAFLAAIRQLARWIESHDHLVPSTGWVMKMTLGYGIIGRNNVGRSVMGKVETPPAPVIDNPTLSFRENATWHKTL